MSMSGEVMSSVALDVALDDLGMLSAVATGRQEYLSEHLSRLTGLDSLQDRHPGSRGSGEGMRTRARSMSLRPRRYSKSSFVWSSPYAKYKHCLNACDAAAVPRCRTRSENESDIVDHHLPYFPSSQNSCLDPVPYIALPIDSAFTSNLFKSRSMESIDAGTTDESVSVTEKVLAVASSAEVDLVSSGLHRLNVSE